MGGLDDHGNLDQQTNFHHGAHVDLSDLFAQMSGGGRGRGAEEFFMGSGGFGGFPSDIFE